MYINITGKSMYKFILMWSLRDYLLFQLCVEIRVYHLHDTWNPDSIIRLRSSIRPISLYWVVKL